jgi:hypothetical protein
MRSLFRFKGGMAMCGKGSWHSVGRLCAFIILGGILLVRAAPVWSAEDSDKRTVGLTKTMEVTVQMKTTKGLLTKELHRVHILQDTVFVDRSGSQITYEAFSAPCKAVLVYEPVHMGDPMAVSVTEKKLLPGSTSAFTPLD